MIENTIPSFQLVINITSRQKFISQRTSISYRLFFNWPKKEGAFINFTTTDVRIDSEGKEEKIRQIQEDINCNRGILRKHAFLVYSFRALHTEPGTK